jgi:imidazolonepropionase-like amidohydrolase
MITSLLAAFLLATAPDSTRWIVSNHGREAGDLVVTTRGDSITARWVFTDRQRGTRVETRYRVGRDGRFLSGESRPVLADGSVGAPTEAFAVIGDSVRLDTPANPRLVSRAAGAWVDLQADTPWEFAQQVKTMLGTPGRSVRLLNGALATANVIADTVLRRGGRPQRARFVVVTTGSTNTAPGVWLDERGTLLATDVAWFITVRPDVVPLLPTLRTIELRWRAAQAERVARTLQTPHSGTVVFRNGNLFDAERGVMVPQQTVVVRGDRIVAMGPAASTAAPAGATVIDATGKTIMPGMWEMHAHVQVGTQGALGISQLAQGLTTARDMASDIDVAVSLRDRERAGRLATPRYVLAGFIEGPLKWAGPTATIVSTEAEARGWVARYDSLGYRQIKLYNAVHPDLVPTIAAEAKRRGLRLSGHIPRGMSIEAAVTLGYDEIQHAAFLFSNFFPDSLWLPQMRAYSNVATAVAPTFDVNGAPMTRLIDFLKAHNTVIDGTFNLWIGGGASVVGAGGSTNQQRADSAYMQLIRRLHAAGVPLVAGTDNASSVTYRRELEMYELAGIPRAKILQIATIDAARIMKEDRDYGSLAVGKVADLLVVNGDPTQKISELTKLETVVRGGRLYQIEALRKAGVGGAQGMSAADGHEPHWD